jgi:hypothetical protein
LQYASYNQRLDQISIDVGKGKGVTAWEKEDYGDKDETVSESVLRAAAHRVPELAVNQS